MKAPGPTKVIVEQSPVQTMVGNLFIPENARIKPEDGRVVAIGSGVQSLSIGDIVLVRWQHGGTTRFHHGGKEYWLLEEKQVYAKLE